MLYGMHLYSIEVYCYTGRFGLWIYYCDKEANKGQDGKHFIHMIKLSLLSNSALLYTSNESQKFWKKALLNEEYYHCWTNNET